MFIYLQRVRQPRFSSHARISVMFTRNSTVSGTLKASMSSSTFASGSSNSSGNSKASVDFARFARETFEKTYGAPTYVAAEARRSQGQDKVISIEYTTSQRDFARDSKRKVAGHMVLGIDDDSTTATVLAKGVPADAGSVSMSLRSPVDSSVVAVLRTASKTERFVEIWHDGALAKSIDVSSVHGEFYGDSTFGKLAWSVNGKSIVYAAEKPEYDKARPEPATPDNSGEEIAGDITDDIIGGVAGIADPRRYEVESDWGETFDGKRPPALVVLDVSSGAARVLAAPDGVSPGQAQCLEECIVFTGYKYAVRKHGIVYCQNRPTGIYTCDFDGGNVKCLHSGSVRSPRVTPSGKGLVFLSTTPGGPHASTSELIYYDLADESATILVPIIATPLTKQQTVGGTQLPAGFVGIYADQLPGEPWLRVGGDPAREVLVFSSTWRSASVVLTLDLLQRELALQTAADGTVGSNVLGANGDIVIGKCSTPAQPEMLVVGEAVCKAGSVSIQWQSIGKPSKGSVQWQVLRGEGQLESVFVYPPAPGHDTQFFWTDDSAAARPLAVVPHGGPHSTYTTEYNALAAGLVQLGFGVLLVNFTGSLGFGQDAVLAQIGKMDTLSIDEIQAAASDVHARGEGDIKRTVYVGGSYSGYTGALLAGMAPGFYRALALRNPVISIGENAAMSDIPDWNYAELGLEYAFDAPPELTPAAFTAMWRASPARLVDKVSDPLLLLVGANDRRVPPPQTLSYFARLKAAGAPAQCKVYPSVGHPLDSMEAERDSFVSIVRFFAAALKK